MAAAYAPLLVPGEPGGLAPALGVPGPAEERGPGRALRGAPERPGLGPGSERTPCSPSCPGPAWIPFPRSGGWGGVPGRIGRGQGSPDSLMGTGESGSICQGHGALPRTP